MEMHEPMVMKSRILSVLPSRETPNRASAYPRRTKLRVLSVEPI
jgi:hypothetical protein